jgi:hypothetical protein
MILTIPPVKYSGEFVSSAHDSVQRDMVMNISAPYPGGKKMSFIIHTPFQNNFRENPESLPDR